MPWPCMPRQRQPILPFLPNKRVLPGYGGCKELRQEGFACYFTMDAGPNVKVPMFRKKTWLN